MELDAKDLRFNSEFAALMADLNPSTLRSWRHRKMFTPVAELLGRVPEGKRVPYTLADVIVLRVMGRLMGAGFDSFEAWRAIRYDIKSIIGDGRWLVMVKTWGQEGGAPVINMGQGGIVDTREDTERMIAAWLRKGSAIDTELVLRIDLTEIRASAEASVVRTYKSLTAMGDDPAREREGT